MKPQHYFERDGSYNERSYKKPPSRTPEFRLDFNLSAPIQLTDLVSKQDAETLDSMMSAMKFLAKHGALPGNRVKAVEKQIIMKAQSCMRKYVKSQHK